MAEKDVKVTIKKIDLVNPHRNSLFHMLFTLKKIKGRQFVQCNTVSDAFVTAPIICQIQGTK